MCTLALNSGLLKYLQPSLQKSTLTNLQRSGHEHGAANQAQPSPDPRPQPPRGPSRQRFASALLSSSPAGGLKLPLLKPGAHALEIEA